jgi:hypothetical protein
MRVCCTDSLIIFRLNMLYSMQHYVIKFSSDLWQVCVFLRLLRFPPPKKLTAIGIWLKVALYTITLNIMFVFLFNTIQISNMIFAFTMHFAKPNTYAFNFYKNIRYNKIIMVLLFVSLFDTINLSICFIESQKHCF